MTRKRRRPTPGYGIPPPLSPITGDQATLRPYGLHPYCAMMQVAEADKYTDYVMCRGFDPRIGKFIDYADGDADKPGIAVAKPFGNRVKCYYQKGQVYPAFLPTQGSMTEGRLDTGTYVPPSPVDVDWRVGQNPGTASESCIGQPQSLADAVAELLDHNGKYVNWMLIDSGPLFLWVRLTASLTVCSTAAAEILIVDSAGDWCTDCTYTTITVSDPYGIVPGSALATGSGVSALIPSGSNVLVMRVMDPKTAEDGTPDVCQWAAVTFGSDICC